MRYRYVLSLVAALTLIHAVANGQAPEPAARAGAWHLPGIEPLGPDDPLKLWQDVTSDYARLRKTHLELTRRQGELVEQLGAQGGGDRRGPSLRNVRSRRKMSRLAERLHENLQEQLRVDAEMQEVAKRVVDNAPRLLERLTAIRRRAVERAESAPEGETGRAARMRGRLVERLDGAITLFERIEADPEHAASRVLDTLGAQAQRGGRRAPGARLAERLDALEREQRFLRQRLDANEEALEELRRRIEELGRFRQQRPRRGARAGRSDGPPPPNHERETDR